MAVRAVPTADRTLVENTCSAVSFVISVSIRDFSTSNYYTSYVARFVFCLFVCASTLVTLRVLILGVLLQHESMNGT